MRHWVILVLTMTLNDPGTGGKAHILNLIGEYRNQVKIGFTTPWHEKFTIINLKK